MYVGVDNRVDLVTSNLVSHLVAPKLTEPREVQFDAAHHAIDPGCL